MENRTIISSQTWVEQGGDLHYQELVFTGEGGFVVLDNRSITVDTLIVEDVWEDVPQFTFTTGTTLRAGKDPGEGNLRPCGELIIRDLQGDLKVVNVGLRGGDGGRGGDGMPGADVLAAGGSGCGGVGACGGDGGAGGDGGDGPDLVIEYASGMDSRVGVSVRRAAGGAGGPGGAGGAGGRNWDGTSAPSGRDGCRGSDGARGDRGRVEVNGKRVSGGGEEDAYQYV